MLTSSPSPPFPIPLSDPPDFESKYDSATPWHPAEPSPSTCPENDTSHLSSSNNNNNNDKQQHDVLTEQTHSSNDLQSHTQQQVQSHIPATVNDVALSAASASASASAPFSRVVLSTRSAFPPLPLYDDVYVPSSSSHSQTCQLTFSADLSPFWLRRSESNNKSMLFRLLWSRKHTLVSTSTSSSSSSVSLLSSVNPLPGLIDKHTRIVLSKHDDDKDEQQTQSHDNENNNQPTHVSRHHNIHLTFDTVTSCNKASSILTSLGFKPRIAPPSIVTGKVFGIPYHMSNADVAQHLSKYAWKDGIAPSLVIHRIQHAFPQEHYRDACYFSVLKSELISLLSASIPSPLSLVDAPLRWYQYMYSSKSVCTHCYQVGHKRQSCKKKHVYNHVTPYRDACWGCGSFEHVHATCNKKMTCIICNSHKHTVRSCPTFRGKYVELHLSPKPLNHQHVPSTTTTPMTSKPTTAVAQPDTVAPTYASIVRGSRSRHTKQHVPNTSTSSIPSTSSELYVLLKQLMETQAAQQQVLLNMQKQFNLIVERVLPHASHHVTTHSVSLMTPPAHTTDDSDGLPSASTLVPKPKTVVPNDVPSPTNAGTTSSAAPSPRTHALLPGRPARSVPHPYRAPKQPSITQFVVPSPRTSSTNANTVPSPPTTPIRASTPISQLSDDIDDEKDDIIVETHMSTRKRAASASTPADTTASSKPHVVTSTPPTSAATLSFTAAAVSKRRSSKKSRTSAQ